MLPLQGRTYLLHGLTATPIVIERLLRDATDDDWDRRPDPERFTLREALAHLADWEGVWRERIEAMLAQDNPLLPSYDEGQWAIEHDYAHADPAAQRKRFRAGRAELVRLLQSLPPDAWERTGTHSEWGSTTIAGLATLVLGHDGYHLRQISEWRDATR